ncbi:hypothetical protein fEgAba01_48 [Acinetobacter phage fEg-Aba01]|nr:hypothetical protein fEgAba01_48 [Acinetobacter phage fEg-Aba01]
MEPATFPINSYSGIVQVINYLNNNHSKAAAEGKPLVVRINQKEDDRSAAQNRLYWAWLEQRSMLRVGKRLQKSTWLCRTLKMLFKHSMDLSAVNLKRITKFWSIPSLKTTCKARRTPLKNSPNIWIRSTFMHIETWA